MHSLLSPLENCQKSCGLQASRTNVSAVPQRHSTQLAAQWEDNDSSLNYARPPKPWAAPEPPEANGLDWTTLEPCDSDKNFPGLPAASRGLYAATLPRPALCTAETSPNSGAGRVSPVEPLHSSGHRIIENKWSRKLKYDPFWFGKQQGNTHLAILTLPR